MDKPFALMFTPACILSIHFYIRIRGQPLNNRQNAHPQNVHYSEVPLYNCNIVFLHFVLSFTYRQPISGSMDARQRRHTKSTTVEQLSSIERNSAVLLPTLRRNMAPKYVDLCVACVKHPYSTTEVGPENLFTKKGKRREGPNFSYF